MSVHRSSVSFEAGGAAHSLRLSTNAMCAYQEASGETVIAALKSMEGGDVDPVRIRALFRLMLGEGRSEVEVGDLIDEIGFTEAAQLIGRAVQLAFPQAADSPAGIAGNAPAPQKSKAT